MPDQFVKIEMTPISSTLKAVLVKANLGADDETVTEWIPFSQISPQSLRDLFDEDNDLRKGEVFNIEVAEWLCKQKNLL